MQYKIPVQIENEDTIFLGLSLRQLFILLGAGILSYFIFKGLLGVGLSLFVSLLLPFFIMLITLFVVFFKYGGMTFIPFILNFIRVKVTGDPKVWLKGVDSYMPIDIGYIRKDTPLKNNKINLENKNIKLKELKNKLNKI